ncbi:MAG: hypothetical protein IPJ65_25035 [Archangiaceae bacterium]|nr:hypothetical protein [Archangiaceae bacterium]
MSEAVNPAGRTSISRARLEKFAPPGVASQSLGLPEQVTRADLDQALARIERDRSAFSDPVALTDYLEGQRAMLAPAAPVVSAPVEDDRVISDVVPQRQRAAKAPPAGLEKIPAAQQAVYAKAGLDEPQMVRAHARGLGPRELLVLLAKPPAFKNVGIDRVRPEQNDIEEILGALEQGVTSEQLVGFHAVWARAPEVPALLAAGFTPEELEPYMHHGDAEMAIALKAAGFDSGPVYEIKNSQLPVGYSIKAMQLGIAIEDFAWSVRDGRCTPDEVYDLWQHYDHGIFEGGYFHRLTQWLTVDEIKQLSDGGVTKFSAADNEALKKTIEGFRKKKKKLPFADIIAMLKVGGTPEGYAMARSCNLKLADYLKLARAGAPENTPYFMEHGVSLDDALRLLATGKPINELMTFFTQGNHHTADEALVLIEKGISPWELKKQYLDRGLSREEAVKVVAAGG